VLQKIHIFSELTACQQVNSNRRFEMPRSSGSSSRRRAALHWKYMFLPQGKKKGDVSLFI